MKSNKSPFPPILIYALAHPTHFNLYFSAFLVDDQPTLVYRIWKPISIKLLIPMQKLFKYCSIVSEMATVVAALVR